jgi:hypothetical protein
MLVNYQFYTDNNYNTLSEDDIKYLSVSERQINSICFNRLKNFEKFPESLQEHIKIIICEHADFIKQNKSEEMNGILKSYSNGSVSYSFDNDYMTVTKINNILIQTDLYQELLLTGLCSRCV